MDFNIDRWYMLLSIFPFFPQFLFFIVGIQNISKANLQSSLAVTYTLSSLNKSTIMKHNNAILHNAYHSLCKVECLPPCVLTLLHC